MLQFSQPKMPLQTKTPNFDTQYGKLFLSSAFLALAMPLVVVVFISIILSIGFAFIPLTVAIASPLSIAAQGSITSYLLSIKLADVYRKLNVAHAGFVAFNTVFTYIAFYYGAFYVFLDNAPFDIYTSEADPNYKPR